MDYDPNNDWAQNDLDGMIHVDMFWWNSSETRFMYQVAGFAPRYHAKYTRGVIEKGEMWYRLAEWEIDKVAAQKEISQKQLGEGDIPDGLSAELRD